MKNLEISRRTPISEQELSWLQKNGGNREGIILFTSGIRDIFSEGGEAVYFWLKPEKGPPPDPRRYVLEQCLIGDKSVCADPNYVLEGESLLVDSGGFKENWPLFLTSSEVNLVGLHLSDFLRINSHRFDPSRQIVGAASFHLIDILTFDYTPSGKERQIVVKTTSGGLRMLTVAKDWQEKLKAARPFGFSNWNGVLDVIEDEEESW